MKRIFGQIEASSLRGTFEKPKLKIILVLSFDSGSWKGKKSIKLKSTFGIFELNAYTRHYKINI